MSSNYTRASHWWQHWVAGVLVPVGIYAEPEFEAWFKEHKFDLGGWVGLVVIAIFYLLAVALLYGFDEMLERWAREAEAKRAKAEQDARAEQIKLEQQHLAQPHEFPAVGLVDGEWIDAIFENDSLIQGSTITFHSTRKGGFKIRGFSYEFDGKVLSNASNEFESTTTMLLPNGIGYVYEGTEIAGARIDDHHGAGFYEFKISDKAKKEFHGFFFSKSKPNIRRVQGRMLEPIISGAPLTFDQKKMMLRDYLLELTPAQTT